MQQEINMCTHVSCAHIVVDLPMKGSCIDNFAGILNRYLANLTLQQKFVIRVTIPGDDQQAEKVYQRYLELKHLVEHSVYLSVMIVLGSDLPNRKIIDRFFGEKLFAVQLATRSFISNQKGYPVLSKVHQEICKQFMKVQARFVLQPKHPQDVLDKHYSYLSYLFTNHDAQMNEDTRGEVQYRNYLQSPLQPLADNLEAATYETFENDSIKYELYE